MVIQKSRVTYDEVVATLPTLKTEEQLNLLGVLSLVLKKSVVQKERKHSLLELEGLGSPPSGRQQKAGQ
ncbi:MAG: hypothetical protein H8E10_17690 [Desulfobacterales bacterium]|nr:hypothetical protein [Desulfobacterales bacterium]MBL7172098.1 hypothetical protein [Desulfobacteraceae bacterium]MBL7205380.1 hypothetical protein [Desulfobacteraceae bacterium]MBU0486300.1 hypothetical protein [Pseudomonadota bacterium]